MGLSEAERIDLKRIHHILEEIKNHNDCGGGWVDFENIWQATINLRRDLYSEIGKRLCEEYLEKS